ncbi:protein of unknown function [Nitratireductor aquimarinus]
MTGNWEEEMPVVSFEVGRRITPKESLKLCLAGSYEAYRPFYNPCRGRRFGRGCFG